MSPRAGRWLALLVPLSAIAAAAGEETLLGCRAIEAAEDRLACYDRVVDRVRGEAVAPEAPKAAPQASSSRAAPAEDRSLRERWFGTKPAESERTLRETYGVEAPKQIAAKVASAQRGPDQLLAIRLDNGQVWKQAEMRTFLLEAGDSVEIEAGAFGSYYLRREGRGVAIRVKRIR